MVRWILNSIRRLLVPLKQNFLPTKMEVYMCLKCLLTARCFISMKNLGDGSTFSPEKHNGVTTTIGLMVEDVDAVMARAVAAGAREISPPKSYDYGYRQGLILDPLGHEWLIEKVL